MNKFRNTLAALVVIMLLGVLGTSCAWPALTGAQVDSTVYFEPGGDKLVAASGGEIELQSGSILDMQTGSFFGETIGFEGATADAYETTVTVVDPTADRTVTIPNETGAVMMSSLATNGTDIANSVTGGTNVLVWEGATADAFETSVSVTDPTADRSIVIPNGAGTVMLSSLATNAADAANAVTGASNGVLFEGATADGFELTLTLVDPTADRTVTIPNETGAVMMSSLATNGTDIANSVTGGTNVLVWEGTADDFETSLSATDATADRSVVIPDGAGTVMLSSLATNAVDAANAVTGASNGLVYEGTANDFETTLSATDPTADRSVVFADAGGTVMLSALATNAADIANAVTGASNALLFEGATADDFEGSLAPADVTADRTWTLPDASGTVMLSALATNAADAANAVTGASNALLFEGATADDFEGSLAPADVTADRTWTLPDLTGTVILQQAAPTAGASGDFIDITATDSASDGTDTTIGLDMNITGAAATGTGNKLYGVDLGLTTADAQQTEVALIVNDADWDYAIDAGDVPAIFTAQTWWHDFMGDAVQAEVVEVSGTDPQAVQAIAAEQFGVYQLTSGDDGANCATDCEGFNANLVYQADQGSLVFQTRLHIDDITNAIVCFGFTDSAALEMPATIGVGTDTPAYVADDLLAFCYDSGSTTANWFALGRDATVASTGLGVVIGTGPANGVYQTFRIEVDAGGEDARFYLNGAEVATCTANCITVTDPITPVVVVDTNAAASVVVDIDYVYASAQRQ